MDRAEAQAVASMWISPYGQSVLTSGCLELGRQRCHQSLEEQDAQTAGSVSAKEGKELGGDHKPVRASWVV
jgi:NAD-dependent DNA ligase